jgi:hypothetical protein
MKMLKTSCGGKIIVPPKTILHLRAHPEVERILNKVCERLVLPTDSSFLRCEVEMGHIVGLAGCVETPAIRVDEPATFAWRLERKGPSRVVVARGVETSMVSLLAFPNRDDVHTYVLITAWVGSLAPKEPWDTNITTELEQRDSLEFWCRHALVYDPSVMSSEPFTSSWGEWI